MILRPSVLLCLVTELDTGPRRAERDPRTSVQAISGIGLLGAGNGLASWLSRIGCDGTPINGADGPDKLTGPLAAYPTNMGLENSERSCLFAASE